jgi:hypothetical protein
MHDYRGAYGENLLPLWGKFETFPAVDSWLGEGEMTHMDTVWVYPYGYLVAGSVHICGGAGSLIDWLLKD